MPKAKVKLNVSRVVSVPDDRRRFITQSAGDVVECDAKEAKTLCDRGQAELVEGTIDSDPETLDSATVDEPTQTETDLHTLEIGDDRVELLQSEDANGKVPSFGSVADLISWTETEGNQLREKKGIGKATEAAILEAIDAWIEAQSAQPA